MVLGMVSTNCYLVYNDDTKEGVVVDPADNGAYILNKCSELGVTPVAVLLTHGHFDHIIGVPEVKRAFHIPVYASETEDAMLADTSINLSCHVPGKQTSFHADVLVHDGDELELLGYKWKVIATPGHTAGSVSYYIPEEEVLLSGDTLFYDYLCFRKILWSIRDMGIQLPLAMKRSTILFRITDKYERGTIDRKQEENDRIINTG